MARQSTTDLPTRQAMPASAPDPAPRRRPRLVEAGDTLGRPGRRAAESDRVARGISEALTIQEMAVSDVRTTTPARRTSGSRSCRR